MPSPVLGLRIYVPGFLTMGLGFRERKSSSSGAFLGAVKGLLKGTNATAA